ncbi:hypothetical protein BC830DRAFT_1162970 [Chytriomyces sp. MP71]|nr:hypothetical protein BC830DRAFT_1162970 [Chytriomyces sp. MP71]
MPSSASNANHAHLYEESDYSVGVPGSVTHVAAGWGSSLSASSSRSAHVGSGGSNRCVSVLLSLPLVGWLVAEIRLALVFRGLSFNLNTDGLPKMDSLRGINVLDEAPSIESSHFHRYATLHHSVVQDCKPAHIHIPAQVPSLTSPVGHNSFDNGRTYFDDSFSPLSSPTRNSRSPSWVPSSRQNSIDLGNPTSSYSNDRLSPLLGSSLLVGQASLQATGGGTAALTPALAVELTKAQMKLSQLKKQKDSIPPIGYICRLCAIEGHWMENCILYKSNKHPQYNNAARAVALNIISPGSQVVLNCLPVVPQPAVHYTPKFVATMHQKQENLLREQQHIQQQQQLYCQQQQQLYLQHQQQQHQREQQNREHQHMLLQREQHYQCNQQMFRSSSPDSPIFGSAFLKPSQHRRESAGTSGMSRFEQIWMN